MLDVSSSFLAWLWQFFLQNLHEFEDTVCKNISLKEGVFECIQ